MILSTRLRAEAFARALEAGDQNIGDAELAQDRGRPGWLRDNAAATDVAPLVTLARAFPAPAVSLAPHTRDRMRRRLVAMAAVAPTEPAGGVRPGGTYRRFDLRWATRRRVSVAASLMAVLLAVVSVGAAAGNALPGDPLYRVKLAAESVQLATTSGKLARGERHLSFAGARLREVDELLRRQQSGAAAVAGSAPRPGRPIAAGSSITDRTSNQVWATLGAMADQTVDGTKDLTEAWQATGDARPLEILANYTKNKFHLLTKTISALPIDGRRAAARSLNLLVLVSGRAEQLRAVSNRCDAACRDGNAVGGPHLAIGTDPLGAVPCSSRCQEAESVTQLTLPPAAPGTETAGLSSALNAMLLALPSTQDSTPTPSPLQSLPQPPAPTPTGPSTPSTATVPSPSSPGSSPGGSTPAPSVDPPTAVTPPTSPAGPPSSTSSNPPSSPSSSPPTATPTPSPTPSPAPSPTTPPPQPTESQLSSENSTPAANPTSATSESSSVDRLPASDSASDDTSSSTSA